MTETKGAFNAVRLSDRVYWVGAVDWAVRDFHGYATTRGSTYNAYLIVADKVILVDTVKGPFREEMFARISSVLHPGRIDYIISNHSEMDHTGCLPETIAAVKPERVFASANGVKALADHFRLGPGLAAVKDGERMSLGGVNLAFFETRMLHWPDSMFTWLPDDGILFSQDAFGMHLASGERFDDGLPAWLLEREAAKYYANILMPFSPLVSALIRKVPSMGISPRIIAPDHGPIWRKDPGWIVGRYAAWAARKTRAKAVIAYDTMWGSTHLMARAIGEGVVEGGAEAAILPLSASHRSDAATELLDAGALIAGSPTLNNGIFPTVADALTYLKGLKFRPLIGAAFGSYGWSGEAVKILNEILRAMQVELVGEGVSARYVPRDETLAACAALGREIAGRLARPQEKKEDGG